MINVNVRTALYGMQVAIPYFRQQGYGHLINLSSILGRMPYTTFCSMYSASEADSRYENIHVTTVLPGMVTADFTIIDIGDSPPDFKISFIGPFPQTTDDVYKIISQVINNRHRPRKMYTNPEHEALIKHYFENVTDFKLLLKPSFST